MGWIITLVVLMLLAILPLGVSTVYDSAGALVSVIFGPIRICFFPGKKKKDKQPKEKKPAKKKESAPLKKTAAKKGGNLTDFLPLVKVALDFLGDLRKKLRVDCLEFSLVLGGGDPCDLAINYGKACAALGNLWPRLEELFVIKKRDVKIQCDFEASDNLIAARLDITITLGRLLMLVIIYATKAIKELLILQNKRKGGATNESDSTQHA